MKRNLLICLLLAGITLGVYWPVTGFEFVNFDDVDYVTHNPVVQQGITTRGLEWAVKSDYASNWHPLTWVSHMADCAVYGLKPGGHHLTSLLFHAANAVLLYLVLQQMTGVWWRSALVAAVFAWHPLHVESVAWVSERKDVLSTFFWLLAMGAYAKHAGAKSKIYYGLTLVFFTLGLLAKPMVVTLPFVLLLLDYWPLRRVAKRNDGEGARGITPGRLVLEKAPFFALAALDCAATVWAQKAAHSVVSAAALPPGDRVANALVSYVLYLWEMAWPENLAVPYPYSHEWTLAQAAGAGILLLLISAAAVLRARAQPFLAVGWFWFLGTLVPVIGLVQVGTQFMADRYTYVPLTGIFIGLAWMIPEAWVKWPRPGLMWATAGAAVLAVLLLCTSVQLMYWRNSVTLFSRAVEVTTGNILAEYNLAEALAELGHTDLAEAHYLKALSIRPNRVEAQYNSQVQSHFNLGLIYMNQQKWAEAEGNMRAVLRAEPELAQAHHALATVLRRENRIREAEQEYRETLRLNPEGLSAMDELAWMLATEAEPEFRNGAEAVRLAEHAVKLSKGAEPRFLETLDAAYAEAGRFQEAIAAAERTRDAAIAKGNREQTEGADKRLELYRSGKPYRE